MKPQYRESSEKSVSLDPEQWVDAYGDYLFRYAMMRLRNRDLAENIVQETFLAALKGRKSFGGRSAERTWMIGILKHKIIDHYRKDFRERPVTDLQVMQTDEEQTIDGFYDALENPKKYPKDWMPDQQAILNAKDFWEVFHGCLGYLPAKTAHAFTMRELDDMQTADICKELGISPTNLWVMLHRARLQLRECLERNWFDIKK
ncbi:MAG: sigma-70 family RNA polymerase sigma factor [Candidatus Omnitrophica bacterium]|nr:sigma-70 family RNA polymerase sigma factor [Candidatus Omnitrophota bacterium]